MAKLLSGTRIYGNLVVDTWANAASANISGTTTSTSTTTGALVVAGGAGIAGNVNIGGNLTVSGNLSITGNITSVNYETVTNTEYVTTLVATTVNAATIGNASATFSGASATLTGTIIASTLNAATIGNSGATLTGTLSTAAQTNITSVGNLTTLSTAGTTTSWGNIVAASGTASTSTSTGALVVQGGAGITGNLFVGGNLILANAVTANSAVIGTTGTYNNTALVLQPQGNLDLSANTVNISNGGTVTALTLTSAGSAYTSVPSITISPPTTTGGVQATARCVVFVWSNPFTTAGTGYTVGNTLTAIGGTGTAYSFTVTSIDGSGGVTGASIVSYGAYTVTPTNPVTFTGGSGSGFTSNMTWTVGSSITILSAGSGYVEQPTVSFSGGGGSGAAAYATVGSGTVVRSLGNTLSFNMPAGGTGLQIYDAGGPSGSTGAYWKLGTNYSSAQAVLLSTATGYISSTGTNPVSILTNSTAQEQFRVAHTASAVNYVQVTGATTGGYPTIQPGGSDTNIFLSLGGKGTGGVLTQYYHRVGVNYANWIGFVGASSGSAPYIQLGGSDTNIDLSIQTKGTGNVTTANPVVITNANTSITTNTGALIVAGGAGIAGNVFAGNVLATGFFYANGTAFVSGSTSTINPAIYFGKVTASTAPTLIDTLPVTGNNLVRWTTTSYDSVYNQYRSSTIDSVNNGVTVNYNEYSFIVSDVGTTVVTFTSNITSGNINLWATGNTASVAVTFQRTVLGSQTTSGYLTAGPAGAAGATGATGTIANTASWIVTTNTTAATSTTTGALQVAGGAGIAGNVFAGNLLATGFFYANGTPFVSSSYGNVQMLANLAAPGNVTIGGNIFVTSNTVSGTSTRVEANIPHPFMLMGA